MVKVCPLSPLDEEFEGVGVESEESSEDVLGVADVVDGIVVGAGVGSETSAAHIKV